MTILNVGDVTSDDAHLWQAEVQIDLALVQLQIQSRGRQVEVQQLT